MTRQPAVALVTAGPGFTNSLSAIANASFSNAPPVFRILPQHPARCWKRRSTRGEPPVST
jgi:thiamine pyrophosphate-dependent acetolactate synthase large subunit-like protein